MDLKMIVKRLKEVQTVYQNYPADAPNGSLALDELIAEVEKACGPIVPDWNNSQGIIDPDMIDDNTFDDGPIGIHITRVHQIHTNACDWRFEGADPVMNDLVLDQFLDYMGFNHSYDDDGERVPDEFMLKVLIGRDPERQVLNAFLNGRLYIEGLPHERMMWIMRNWKEFYEGDPKHLGFMVEVQGGDT
jgi:hypothetical protein